MRISSVAILAQAICSSNDNRQLKQNLQILQMDIAIKEFMQTTCFKELRVISDCYTEQSGAQIVAMKDNIIRITLRDAYAYLQVVHVKQVGATPFNRGGEGLLVARAHSRVRVIKQSGCSFAAIRDNAVLVEDDPLTKEFGLYTENLCKTDPRYARMRASEIRFANLGATHAFHGFACAHDEVECLIPDISENGKMSKTKIFSGDALLQEYVEVGVPSVVIKYVVHATLPKISEIVMRALNTVMQVGEGQTKSSIIVWAYHAYIYMCKSTVVRVLSC